jgi:hypothetical protein
MVGNSAVPIISPIASGEVRQTAKHKIAKWYCIGMTQELQNFLILLCLLVSYPIMPALAWQERDKHPTLAIIVIALWAFIVPVFAIGSSPMLWSGASRIITAPFSAAFSYEPSSEVFQQSRIRLRYAPRWDI